MTDLKQSQFTKKSTILENDYFPIFGNGTNEKILKSDVFSQIKDELNIYIYPTILQLKAANLIADPDFPVYVRVEETGYQLYKITSLAAGVSDIIMNNGTTASLQLESSKVSVVNTFAALASAAATVGQIVTIASHTSGGLGGGDFEAYAATHAATDGGSHINSATDGVRFRRINYSWLDIQMFGAIGDGVATDTTAIQAAIDATYGQTLFFPKGKYKCGKISAINTFKWIGESHGLYPTDYTLDQSLLSFSLVPAGQTAIIIGDTLNQIIGCVIDGVGMAGNGTNHGMYLGGTIAGALTDSSFSNMNLYNFSTGITQSFVYDVQWTNVRVQSSVTPLVNGSQVNACVFTRCAFVTFSGVIAHTNCEGVHYDTCDISNSTSATSPLTFFQSTVTFTNPYFENITSTYLATVGGSTESSPSSVVINNPLKINNDIAAGIGTAVEITGKIRGTCRIVGTQLNHCPSKVVVGCSRDLDVNSSRIVSRVDGGYHPLFALYGGAALTYTPMRGYYIIANAAAASTGVTLTTSLTIGVLYTAYIAIKGGVPGQTAVIRHNAVNLGFTIAASTDPAVISRVPFVATATSLVIQFSGTIEYFGHYIVEGNETGVMIDCFSRSLNKNYQGSSVAAPASGTWSLGDVLLNTAPASAGYYGTICTVAGTPGTWTTFGLIT
jgi:hypothetical protein